MVRRLATASMLFLASSDTSSSYVKASASSASSTASSSTAAAPNADNHKSAGKLRSLAEQAVSEHNYDEALSLYTQAIDYEPDNATNYYKLYRIHSRLKNYHSALTDITAACDKDPADVEYRLQKAKLLVSLGRCDEAVEQHKVILHGAGSQGSGGIPESIAQSLQNARIEAMRCEEELKAAQEAFASENYKDAAYLFHKALSHMEQAPDILFLKAQAQYHIGDYFGVISDTGKILKVHKQNIEAYQLRGEAYFRTGDHDVAVQHFREGLKLDPEHKGCKAGHKLVKSIVKKEKRGDDAERDGRYQDAIDYWWQAVRIDDSHRAFVRPTLLKIAKGYSEIGKNEDAIATMDDYLDEEETLEGIVILADILLAADEFEKAVHTYRKAMEVEVS